MLVKTCKNKTSKTTQTFQGSPGPNVTFRPAKPGVFTGGRIMVDKPWTQMVRQEKGRDYQPDITGFFFFQQLVLSHEMLIPEFFGDQGIFVADRLLTRPCCDYIEVSQGATWEFSCYD